MAISCILIGQEPSNPAISSSLPSNVKLNDIWYKLIKLG